MEQATVNFPFLEFSDEEILKRIKSRNPSSAFLPVNTKGDAFGWDVVIGNFLGAMLNKQIGKYTYEQFREDAKDVLLELLESEDAWPMLDKAYFEQADIFNVSPEFLMFHANLNKTNGADTRVSCFYSDLLEGQQIDFAQGRLNFLEKEFARLLQENLRGRKKASVQKEAYLPFMAGLFCKDLEWLSGNSKYFLREIKNFLSLYAFLYAAQLGLSISDWNTAQAPAVKPLYFILESEKASMERTSVQEHGYHSYKVGVDKVFPMLTMNEMLQLDMKESLPLWKAMQLFNAVDCHQSLVSYFNRFAAIFLADRKLEAELPEAETVQDCVKLLCQLSELQFTDKKSARHGIHAKYASNIDSYFGDAFIQSRGRVGKVLVLSQDSILLLTNLVIGDQGKLRFYEVVKEFQARGIYLDKQSEQELIAFYDRIGNAERLSDSGDAVYVCKTV